jgi:hypothetical protein
MSEEVERISGILEANKGKEFVQRILDPENSPSMDLGKGWTGTHLMAAEYDPDTEKWMVFPTIVNLGDGLQKMPVEQAMRHAKDSGEYIDFADDKEQALWFSKSYKKVWKIDDESR